MNPFKKLNPIAAALVASLLATTAFAVPVVVSFNATLQGDGLGSLAAGSVISGSITFDDAQLGSDISPYGTYYNSFATKETIGSQTVVNPFSYAQIANDSAIYYGDLVALTVNYPSAGGLFSLGGLTDIATGFRLGSSSGNLINNESLASVTGLNLANANTTGIFFYDGSSGPNQGQAVGYGLITSWQASNVPDEGLTLVLLGLGGGGLFCLRRRFARS